ncbi:DUF1481 domain-containing protein [Photobacterium sp. WH77]|uniref:DUF1481 domain-containing protein n=1 Tax=Photobacterium arenosum TaxID=2774143 RepID=A0ABR9BQ36_9GAMM|nr:MULTISPECIES: DUF1481 domain-containing protein [Photobacterium]MBD8514681.1 DUF1481 domain-containing protein [Photobacterium arenosum]MBV7263785.1 DUF1481 domain-containing protein [Photobacterium sp. WH24]MCG2838672.1 DUF1481 domain-containing protein [Photobacterium sp. WH77]MCG2846289.1 DUF1481 domain-containing protein [Photobacterium sp. WH80]
MKRTCLIVLTFLLSACGSSALSQHTLSPLERLSGGQVVGDASSLYWVNLRQSKTESLAERVWMGDYGEYQTDYRWHDGQLRELKRAGTALKDDKHQPFELHVRYDQHGEAVFQRYKVGDTVFPLSDTQLHQLSQQADMAVALVREQSREGFQLVQGVWDGQRFVHCDAQAEIEINWQQINAQPGYIALIGKSDGRGKVTAQQMVLNRTTAQHCLTPPRLLDVS